jgi:hypothetical protein
MSFLFRGRLSTDKGSHETRDSVRESSTISSNIKSSLQPCSDPHLLLRKLSSLEHIHRKSETLVRKLVGLQRVLLELMLPGNTLRSGADSSTCGGMILFSDASELFSSYYPHPIDEDHFRDCLLHPEYGLYVCIAYLPNLKKRYLIHKSESIDVCMLIKCITSTSDDNESISKLNSINKEQVQSILKSMDTEWDKTCARMLFSAGKTNSVINECGIDASLVRSNKSRFLEICQEISNTSLEARNAVVETLGHKKEKLLEEINLIDKTIERKSNVWSDMQIADLQNKKLALQERIESLEKVESCSDKRNRQKFQQSHLLPVSMDVFSGV